MSAARELLDKKLLKGLFPLNNLSAVHLKEVTKKATIQEVPAGQFLLRKGKRDSETYYLLSGEVSIIDGRHIVGTIRSGAVEAKRPLVPGQPRPFSVRTNSKTTIMRIDTSLLDVLLDWDQSAKYEVSEIQANADEDWMTKMLKSELFAHIPAENIQNIIMRMKEVRVKKGSTIINQHEEGDCYYVVKKGQCVVSRQTSKDSKPVLIAELRDGDSFGEEALVSDGRRNATVTMITNGSLMRLSKQDFSGLVQDVLVNKASFSDACALVQAGALWLDVQLPGDSLKRSIPHCLNIPYQGIRNSTDKLNINDTYVVFCADGRQSANAVFLLGQMGYAAVALDGGLNAIPRASIEAVTPGADTSAEIIRLNTNQSTAPVPQPPASALQKEKPKISIRGKEKKAKSSSKKVKVLGEHEISRTQIDKMKSSAVDKQLFEDMMIDQKATEAQINSLNGELKSAKKILKQKETELSVVSEEKEKISRQFNRLSEKLGSEQSTQETVDELHDQLEEMQYEHELERKQLEKEVGKLQKASDKADGLRGELKSIKQELKASNVSRTSLEKEAVGARKQSMTLQGNTNDSISKLEQELSSTQARLGAMENENQDLKQSLNGLNRKLSGDQENASSKIDLVSEELSRSRDEYRELQERLTVILAEKEAFEKDNLELKHLRNNFLEQQSSHTSESGGTIDRLNDEIKTLRGELDSSRSLVGQLSQSVSEGADDNDKEILETLQKQLDRVQALENQNTELHELLTANEKNIEKLKDQKSKIEFDWQAAEKSRTGLVEQHASNLKEFEEKRRRLEQEVQNHIASKQELQQSFQKQIEEQEVKQEEFQRSYSQIVEERDRFSRDIKNSRIEFGKEEESLRNEIESLKQTVESRDGSLKELEVQVDTLQTDKSNIETSQKALLKGKQNAVSEWEDKYEQMVSKFRAVKYRNDQLETEVNIFKTDYEQEKKRADELDNLKAELFEDLKKAKETHVENKSQDEEYSSLLADMNSLEKVYKQEKQTSLATTEELKTQLDNSQSDLEKYKGLQNILEEKNQELEDEITYFNEKQKQIDDYEKEIHKLKRKLDKSRTAAEGGQSEGEGFVNLQHDYSVLQEEFDILQNKLREVEREKMQSEREVTKLERDVKSGGTNAEEQASHIKSLNKEGAKADKTIGKLNSELAMSKSSLKETETEIRNYQKELKAREKKLVKMESDLKANDDTSEQVGVLKNKLESVKKDTKDQLKHYQYEYETMVQKTREENRGLRMEVDRLQQQLQEQMVRDANRPAARGQNLPPQVPDDNVMPLDLPLESAIEIGIPEILEPGLALQPGGNFTVPVTPATSSLPLKRATSTTKTLSRAPGLVYSSEFKSIDNDIGEPVNLGKVALLLVFIALLGVGGYWYFEIYPKMEKASSKTRDIDTPKKIPKISGKGVSSTDSAKVAKGKPSKKDSLAKIEKKKTAAKTKKDSKKNPKAGKMLPGKSFRDALQGGKFGPVMTEVSQGVFIMGSGKGGLDTNETPRHKVSIRKISVSKNEVTFEDYRLFAKATGRSIPDDKDWGEGTRPVINVSWRDAVAYTKWLSSQTGNVYRLPTESEWEYAARAGTNSQYSWGNSLGKNMANCFDCSSKWDSLKTAPTGSFKSNPVGLNDMHGNVMEWTQDCYHPNYKGAPKKGSAWISGSCATRVVRGGSYKSAAESIRAFAREHMPADTTSAQIGFRVVREM